MMAKRLASAELQSGSLLAAERPYQASGTKKNPATIFGRNTSSSARSKEPLSEQSAISSKRRFGATRDAYSGKYLRAGR